jgi:hypothetical protein
MIQVKNLFLQFEVISTHLPPCNANFYFFIFLASQKTRRLHKTWWKEPKQSTHWDLILIEGVL